MEPNRNKTVCYETMFFKGFNRIYQNTIGSVATAGLMTIISLQQ